ATDRDERVAAQRQRVGQEVLELASLVPTERQPRVAILALRPDCRAAEVFRQAVEPVDRRRTEQQRIAREVRERTNRWSLFKRCHRRSLLRSRTSRAR